MFTIENEAFGKLVSSKRKEQNMTQKELGDRLYVSDKTVSKWERGMSFPHIELLVPLANTLNVTLDELFTGEKKDNKQNEEVLKQKLNQQQKKNKIKWVYAYIFVLVMVAIEIGCLVIYKVPMNDLINKVLPLLGLLLVFAGWFVFFIQNQLPGYYDENKISYVAQGMGMFRIHLPGLSFNNSNWPIICSVVKGWTLICSILIPFLWILMLYFKIQVSLEICQAFVFLLMLSMVLHIYSIGKKYE